MYRASLYKILFSFAIVLLCQIVYGQSLQIASKFGGTSTETGRRIKTDINGNVYVAGSFQSTNVDFDPSPAGSFIMSSAGKRDLYVAKYDSSGIFKWAFRVGGPDHDDVIDIELDKTGHIVIAGYFRGGSVDFDPSSAVYNLNSNGESGGDPGFGGDGFVAKYDTLGNFKWAFNIGGTSIGEACMGVGIDGNNNILVTGYIGSPADFDPSPSNYILDGWTTGPLFVAKYTADAQLQWVFNTGQPNMDNAGWDVAADSQNNVVVAGYFQGWNIDFNPSPTIANTLSSNGGFEIFLAKYTQSGQYLWAHSFGGSGYDDATTLAIDHADNIYIIGNLRSNNVDFDPGAGVNTLSSGGNSDAFLAKYSPAGQHIWAFSIGSSAEATSWGIALDGENHVLVAGIFNGANVDFDPSAATSYLSGSGNADAFVAKYSLSGQYVCAFKIGSSGYDDAVGISCYGNSCWVSGSFSGSVDFDPGAGNFNLGSSSSAPDTYFAKYTWTGISPAGIITGSTICPGQQAQMIFSATAGSNPFTLSIANGTHSYTISNVQSGVPFNLPYSPLESTTYTLTSIKDGGNCSPLALASDTALIRVFCGVEDCSNGIDDDGDGLIDCADPDCLSCTNTACGPLPTISAKIFNTGNNGQGGLIPVGSVDRHWTISNSLNGTPYNAIYTGNCAPGYWTPSPYVDAGWITDKRLGICGFQIPQFDSAHRYFSTTFNVPASIVSSLRLAFDVYADNYIGEVYLNGIPQGIRVTNRDLYCAGCNISFTLSNGFVAGANTITILVLQKPIPEMPLGQNVGLLVNASASLDSDADGVVDGIDKCPGTPPGVTVDQFGCFKISITANSPVCAGDSLVLQSSNAGSGSVYEWTTPTGQVLAGTRIVLNNITAADAGRYRLKVTDTYNCTRIDSTDVVLNTPPIVAVSSDPSICKGTSVQLSASGGTWYKWSPTTGLNDPNIANPVASPTIPTTYKVVVKNAAGCRDSAHVTVNILASPAISSSGNTSVCKGDSTQLSVSGGTTYQWNPTIGLSNPGVANPKASPSSTTTYRVVVTGSNGCKDSINLTVGIDHPPTITVNNNVAICPGDSAQLNATGGSTYQWSPATGLNFTNIPNPKASPAVPTTYKVVATSNAGCKDSVTTMISLKPKPTASASTSTTICAKDSAQLSSGGGNSFQWFPATGLSDALSQNPKASPSNTTNYSVIVTNSDGCRDTASTIISVRPLPQLNLGNNFNVCPGVPFTLDATTNEASGYLWNTGSTNASISSTAPGVYYVNVSITGCTTQLRDTITVGVDELPKVALGKDTTACEFSQVLIKAKGSNIQSYLWNNGSTDSTIVVSTEGLYVVTVQNQCGSAKDDIYVKIASCSDELFFPAAFTPNQNGRNDIFKAGYLNANGFKFYELRVYNRWGEIVFQTNDITKGWDGYYNGRLQTTGVFVWYARYRKTTNNKIYLKKGTVTLIR